ncbi:hypothetical protein GGF50DRAFT_110888 [Schizophyllum commune]
MEAAIVAACREHQVQHGRRRAGYVVLNQYIVQYGEPAVLDHSVKMRVFLASTEPRPDKPYIPQLIHHFDNGQGTAYVVLEYVKLAKSPVDLDKRIAAVVTWLSGLQTPPGHKLGPLGGGHIRHAFFDGQEAPLPFESVEALERYVEKGRTKLYKHGQGIDPISLRDERLLCTQADLDKSHFGVDEAGRTVLMGLRSISFVPETFARYTLVNAKLATLADRLGLSGESDMKAMAAIAHVLGMTADSTLGLDNQGKTVKRDDGYCFHPWLELSVGNT